jgi:hypothetical protein
MNVLKLSVKVKRYPWAVSYGNKYLDRTIEWTRNLLRSRQVPIPSPQNSDSESGKSIIVFLIKVRLGNDTQFIDHRYLRKVDWSRNTSLKTIPVGNGTARFKK